MISQNAIEWLAHGKRGISSETIFSHLTGVDALRGWHPDTPRDPADFRRCRLLLEAVPEFEITFDRMRTVSLEWSRLVDHWSAICELMDVEMPYWRIPRNGDSAPRTYQMMKDVMKGMAASTTQTPDSGAAKGE